MTSITNEIRIFFSEIRRFYREFLRETEKLNFSDQEKAKIRLDYIKELLRHRYRFDEYYYQYEFPKLNQKERAEFISRSEMQYVYRKYGDSEIRKIFRDKAKFLEGGNKNERKVLVDSYRRHHRGSLRSRSARQQGCAERTALPHRRGDHRPRQDPGLQ